MPEYVREYRLPHWPPGAKVTVVNEPSERALEHYRQLSREIAERAVERGWTPDRSHAGQTPADRKAVDGP